MSSDKYSACLRVDPTLRQLVLVSGVILAAVGVPLIMLLPTSMLIRLPVLGLWLCLCARDLHKLKAAYTRYCGLQMRSDGEIRLRDNDGNWHKAQLLAGSMLLRRLGWIRIGDSRGPAFAELVRGTCREDQQWRRLQVIWRHIGAHT